MNLYRLFMTIEEELEAETHEEAWVKFRERVREGYYGPTRDDIEFVGTVREEETPIKEE